MRGTIRFLCVANSARSQIVEALARQRAPAGAHVQSAGSQPTQVHPHALAVLSEARVPTTGQRSKPLDAVAWARVAAIITLCAEEACPVPPPTTGGEAPWLSWALPDPAAARPERARLAKPSARCATSSVRPSRPCSLPHRARWLGCSDPRRVLTPEPRRDRIEPQARRVFLAGGVLPATWELGDGSN